MSSKKAAKPLWHPRYWFAWCNFALWWMVIQLPYRWLETLSRGLGKVLVMLPTRRRYIAQRNLELCFPRLTQSEQKRLLCQHFQSFVLGVFEVGICWWWPLSRFEKLVRVEGLEHLQSLDGQGALLLAFHFTHLDIGANAISHYAAISGVYKPNRNPVFEKILIRGRERRGRATNITERLFEVTDIRGIIRALKNGTILWYAPDQDLGAERSVFVPFFGVNTATITATTKLVKAGNAKVIPMLQSRTPDHKIQVTIFPPLENFPGESEIEDAKRINQLIETFVLRQPADYLWMHRRFKSRPAGEPSLYER